MANDSTFICGVIEGFYGRPWTQDQRVDLYKKLEHYQLNCYVYAPKDDLKHRLSWRELYTDEEAESLRHLIAEARLHNQMFVYALSPGNDIRYSDEGDINATRRKLEQVQSLGCTSFALLFDDIPKEMHRADQDRYDSFAQAQVQVTNKIYEMLGRPVFMFCPTEYCETRAHPRIADSEYLDTVGRFLHSEIYVMWTGRSVAVKESISGLLLNPNNKHETNLMAIATTSQWRHAVADADGMNTEDNASSKVYCPEEALNKALADWESFSTRRLQSAAVSRSGSVAMDSDLTVPPDVSAEVALPVMAVDEMVHAVMGDPNLQDATEPDLVNSLVPEYNTCTVMGTPIGANSHKNSHEEGATGTSRCEDGSGRNDNNKGKDRKAKINLWKPHGVSSDITQRYPSRIHLHAKFCTDDSVAMKRIVQTLATVLSYSGSAGVHVVCEPDDYQKISFLAKLQFNLIPTKRADGLEIYGYR
ncbi:unnamed protein product, partial [Mesorhabditis spiculigera]